MMIQDSTEFEGYCRATLRSSIETALNSGETICDVYFSPSQVKSDGRNIDSRFLHVLNELLDSGYKVQLYNGNSLLNRIVVSVRFDNDNLTLAERIDGWKTPNSRKRFI